MPTRSQILGITIVTTLSFVGLILPSLVSACDPLGCLLIGKEQDLLALVTVIDLKPDTNHAIARPEHIYQKRNWKESHTITIANPTTTNWATMPLQANQQYLVSLACNEKICTPKWGMWEVDGKDFRTAKLRRIRSGDDAAIQWFLNGRGSSFYSEYDKMYAHTSEGDIEIYPRYPHPDPQGDNGRFTPTKKWLLPFTILGLIGFVGSTLYYRKAKSHL